MDIEHLGPGTVKFLLNYSKLKFMVPGPNVGPNVLNASHKMDINHSTVLGS